MVAFRLSSAVSFWKLRNFGNGENREVRWNNTESETRSEKKDLIS